MKRRFSITEEEGYLIIAALDAATDFLETEANTLNGITPRERITLAQLKALRTKLIKYNWEK